jgi:hypothetical protein
MFSMYSIRKVVYYNNYSTQTTSLGERCMNER